MDDYGEILGYCGNNEDHYGRICDTCMCCLRCCECEFRAEAREGRLARLKARSAAAHKTYDATVEALRDELETRGIPARYDVDRHGPNGPYWLLPLATVHASSSRKYGAHIEIKAGWGCGQQKSTSFDVTELADSIEKTYAAGLKNYIAQYAAEKPGLAEKIEAMRAETAKKQLAPNE